jgi:hypothetical protein
MPDQVRHDGKEEKAGFWLGTCQNDVKGEPALKCSYSGSSRNALIRDLALPKDGFTLWDEGPKTFFVFREGRDPGWEHARMT